MRWGGRQSCHRCCRWRRCCRPASLRRLAQKLPRNRLRPYPGVTGNRDNDSLELRIRTQGRGTADGPKKSRIATCTASIDENRRSAGAARGRERAPYPEDPGASAREIECSSYRSGGTETIDACA